MSISSTVKKTVRPVVGERGWRLLRTAKRRGAGPPSGGPAAEGRRLAPQSREPCPTPLALNTDKWGTHRYAQHYQRHLQHLKNESFNLLEIGIGGYSKAGKGGASLRMWKHFFPAAHIYGMDIRDKSFVDEDRITTFVADQSDPESLRAVAGKIGELDVIIDDGSHLSPHILVTFETLFPLLRDGGIYAVEHT